MEYTLIKLNEGSNSFYFKGYVVLSLNTNLTSLMVQKNLNNATKGLNSAIEKLTTGYKLNHAKDNPANYAMSKNIESKISSWNVASENINIGNNLLETASSTSELISQHIIRIRDLCEQACNGTYGENSKKAIREEIDARLDEISRIRENTFLVRTWSTGWIRTSSY